MIAAATKVAFRRIWDITKVEPDHSHVQSASSMATSSESVAENLRFQRDIFAAKDSAGAQPSAAAGHLLVG
eukprot:scaffold3715_cov37-Tisochrysis_lutea.AAC.2